MPAQTRFCQLCASEEGFGLLGSKPTRLHNPGDLRHSPHSQHPGDPNAIGEIDSDDDGWKDFERQAQLWAGRGLTVQQAVYEEAPPGVDGNNSAAYLAYVLAGLNQNLSAQGTEAWITADTPLSTALLIPATPSA